MILGAVEETVTTVEIDEETYEELYKVLAWLSPGEGRKRAVQRTYKTQKRIVFQEGLVGWMGQVWFTIYPALWAPILHLGHFYFYI